MSDETSLSAVELATELTIAWLSNQNNRVAAEDVPAFLRTMHATITALSTASSAENVDENGVEASEEFTPAVSVRKSLASKDHIISLIDGKPYRALRRHLATHGLTPEEYRARYKLKSDYPMVAPNYSEQRRALAHKIGLGAKGRGAKTATKPARQSRAKSPTAS
jgi:predicted transcriptional regulator